MANTYNIQEFGKLIGKSTKTLQKWDREGRLVAHRSPQSNRRYYTHDQYLEYRGLKAAEQGDDHLLTGLRGGTKAGLSQADQGT